MVTTGDLSNESTTNSGTGLVSFFNAILSTEADEQFSFDDRREKPVARVSRRFHSGLCSDGTDHITDRVASLNLDRERGRTKRSQEIPRVKDFAHSEDARLMTPQADDSLRGFHDDWRCDGVNVLASCDCAAFCIA
jgi:hypothetical protein